MQIISANPKIDGVTAPLRVDKHANVVRSVANIRALSFPELMARKAEVVDLMRSSAGPKGRIVMVSSSLCALISPARLPDLEGNIVAQAPDPLLPLGPLDFHYKKIQLKIPYVFIENQLPSGNGSKAGSKNKVWVFVNGSFASGFMPLNHYEIKATEKSRVEVLPNHFYSDMPIDVRGHFGTVALALHRGAPVMVLGFNPAPGKAECMLLATCFSHGDQTL